MTPAIPLDQRFTARPDVLVRELDGEAVLLDLASQSYFGLNPSGFRIWELLVRELTVGEVVETLEREVDVDRATLLADVVELSVRLAEAGLLLPRA